MIGVGAVEMTGPWKAWKTGSRFSTLPTAPWKSRQQREIPTFPQPGDERCWRCQKNKNQDKKGSRPLRGLRSSHFQDHLVLETKPRFRIILGLENAAAGMLR
jgi:hypothetical protein